MPPIQDLTILVPVDVSEPEPPPLAILDVLEPFEVVLVGYFPVPDQAEPALIKDEYEAEAGARLDRIAGGRADVTEVLVFTHDREATIDRVADQYGCEAVLTAGDTAVLNQVLVPVRGDANLERIVSVVANLLKGSDATVTFFHALSDGDDASHGEFLLRGTVDRLVDHGIEPDRVDWELEETDEPSAAIVERGAAYDLVVLGETEPSLRERIIGATLARVIDELPVPALVVRDV